MKDLFGLESYLKECCRPTPRQSRHPPPPHSNSVIKFARLTIFTVEIFRVQYVELTSQAGPWLAAPKETNPKLSLVSPISRLRIAQ
jgi:hypothetical protein